jgi:hydrogenase maturation protease
VTDQPTVVLGLGNLLRRDEGLGIWALQRLADHHRLPASVRLLDGGTLGLDLISEVEGCASLVVVDAILAGAEPGTLVRLAGEEVPGAPGLRTSMHEVGLDDLLAVLRLSGSMPRRVVVLGVEPAETELGWGLSPAVEGGLDALVEAAAREVSACMR